MILVVTSKDDLTSDYLIRRLEERGVPLFRFNTEDLLSAFDVSLLITGADSRFKIWDRVRGTAICSSDIVGAYFRKPQRPLVPLDCTDRDEQAFASRELVETLRSVWRLIPRSKWLNAPESLFLASNKVKQLTIAREIGFRIPETLVSSRPTDVLTFAKRHGNDVIAKAVKNGFLISRDTVSLIFTSMIESKDFDSIANCDTVVPNIIQPRLEKDCDLRITVVGDSVYPAAIRSQRHSATSIDWRTWDTVSDVDLVQETYSLPNDVADMCRELNARLDLDFSCIDMVLTKEGAFYFLEVNPNGQWAWVEEMVGLPIRDAIIDHLVRGKPCDAS
jgi:ribosomal protein S6-L-glutamate ligase RimK-like protein